MMLPKSTTAFVLGSLYCCSAAFADTSVAGSDAVVTQLPESVVGEALVDDTLAFGSSPMFAGTTYSGRSAPGCVVSDSCFPRPTLVVDTAAPEPRPSRSLQIGEYGPLMLKFYGNRVKMRLRF